MKKSKVEVTPDLINDLKTVLTSTCVGFATAARDDFNKAAQEAIEAFYDDYSPIKYRRHYYNFRENSFEKYYKNPHGQIVRGGIQFTPDSLDDIYKLDSTLVFSLVIEEGAHGGIAPKFPPPLTPTPLEMVEQYRDEWVANGWKQHAKQVKQRISNNSYKTITVGGK